MGGSILGSKAIFNFFKNKMNKEFIFLDNLDENNLLKLKKQKIFRRFYF